MVLENYGNNIKRDDSHDSTNEGPPNRWVQEVLKVEGGISSSSALGTRLPSWKKMVNDRGELSMTV